MNRWKHTVLIAVFSPLLAFPELSKAGARSNDELIGPLHVKRNQSLRVDTSGSGNVPQEWVFKLIQLPTSIQVTAREVRTGRVQVFSFVLDDMFHAVLARGKLESGPQTPAVAVGLDYGGFGRTWAFLVFDYNNERFVALKSSSKSSRWALRFLNPERAVGHSGQWYIVERTSGSGVGSLTCWRLNRDGTRLTPVVQALMDMPDSLRYRYEIVVGDFELPSQKPRVRYLPKVSDELECDDLLKAAK